MDLSPYRVRALSPKIQVVLVASPLFVVAFLLFRRVPPRIPHMPEARDGERDEKRAEAGLGRQALEDDAAALAAIRAEGHRARDAILAEGRARIEAHCAAAETELRISVSELASNLAADGPRKPRRTP